MKTKIIIPNNRAEAVKNLDDPAIRVGVTKNSFLLFLQIYFPHHLNYKLAYMHMEMINICESTEIELALIMAFRGSGKSTIVSNAYPLWAILGAQKKKFVVIITKTIDQAKIIMRNIKSEAEDEGFLKKDLGPFKEVSDEWGAESIIFKNEDARIMVLSIEKSLKGIKHRQHRPDLIILDDVEDNESTKTRAGRDKTFEKYVREIVPLGDKNTKILHVGNMLHNNSLMMRLSENILSTDSHQVFKRYPIIDEKNNILWQSKFTDLLEIEKLRKKVGDEVAWHLEYLLRVIANVGQIVNPKDIQFYDNIPANKISRDGYFPTRKIIVGIDLAISESNNADFTAIVPVLYNKVNDKWEAYVLKEFVHKRLQFPEVIKIIMELNKSLKLYTNNIEFAVESVGYQEAVVQAVKAEDEYVEIVGVGVRLGKEERLRSITPMFSNKLLFFPSVGAEVLIEEILGFGSEKHDDLVDALVYALRRGYESILNTEEVFIAE